MRAITGEVTSSNPLSLSKAAAVLSRFASSETGARPDISAYLKRTSAAFNELVDAHRQIRAHNKRSHFDVKESATQEEEEDNSPWKKKKKKKKKEEMKQSSMMKVEGFDSENMRKEDGLQEVDGLGFVSENKKRKKGKFS